MNTVIVNGETYIKAGSVPETSGRAVVVIDRGWIFAGDVEEENGRIKLHNVVWLFRWDGIGFDGVLADPKSPKAILKKLDHVVDIPENTEIFRIPVADRWGL